ncbi:pesticidal protein Cry7Aa [Sinomicrobium pectinilyticum]|uniref:Pesticidal protein Cry7Aa n=1 Tax=Sinomicrobium pectinilyticum TaxID=1084421 RepID=A0A3N0DHW2_SINP1|nr:pesticidal protein Cry7Aa [Sinomicrobium pectinilyticum]RNL75282.1 pesticidal protein Cry7Aa [Sinomicrobium pectinilyticum]
MDTVTKHGVLLEKTDNSFENEGVFNPAIVKEGDTVHMFYRAVRKGNFSSLGYCKLHGPLNIVERSPAPVFFPEKSYEFQGTEDPRITKIDDTYYLAYTAYDGINVFGAYATSQDLRHFERKGIITPRFTLEECSALMKKNVKKINIMHMMFYNFFTRYNLSNLVKGTIHVWDKNIVFFPKRINGKLTVLHRLYPSIQLLSFGDPSELTSEFWARYISNLKKHIILYPRYKHENGHIGAGCPPIETEDGWLVIYHSAQFVREGYIYHACAVLLDLENPKKVIGRLRSPLFSPTLPWEKKGTVDNVVFPTGTARFGDELYIYYGAADCRVAAASVNINSLLQKLKST